MQMTIKGKLRAVLFLIMFLVAGFGSFLLYVQDRLSVSIQDLETRSMTIQALSELQLAVDESLMPANDYIITGNPRYAREFADMDLKIEDLFNRLSTKDHFTAHDLERISTSRRLYGEVKKASQAIFALPARDSAQAALMETMDYKYAAPMVKELAEVKRSLNQAFSLGRTDAARLREVGWQVSLLAMVAVVALLLFVGGAQGRSISRALDEVVVRLGQVAEGQGDLTQRLVIGSRDELGMIAERFNRFIGNLHGMIQEVVKVARHLTTSSVSLRTASTELHQRVGNQKLAIGIAATCLDALHMTATRITHDADELQKISSTAASASQELSASFDEVVRLTEQLDLTADVTMATVEQISGSSDHVARNVEELQSHANEVAGAVASVRDAALEIVASARDQARIARGVQDDATLLGLKAINETTSRMERLREAVSDAAEAMDSLGQISKEIGRIVSIIGEVTGKTNLLALNASIIAAQAGEHGRSFAVVADEVKALAQRTASSTKEIEMMIVQVQEKTASAITVVHQSAVEAKIGVSLAQDVGTTFTSILEKTAASLAGAEEVVGKADRQSAGINGVMALIDEMRAKVEQINQSAEEQSRSAGEIVRVTKKMRVFTRDVRNNVGSQSDENLRINKIFQDIFDRVHFIAAATAEQREAIQAVADEQKSVLVAAAESEAQIQVMEETILTLDKQAEVLTGKVASFTI